MKETAKTGRINIGTASIVLILLILCLAVFSLLSLSDAQASLSFARRRAESVQAFYQADAKAQAWADSIRGMSVSDALSLGTVPEGASVEASEDSRTVTLTIPLSQGQSLLAEYRLSDGQLISSLHFQQRGLRHRHAAACMDRAGGSRNNGRVICPSSF